ncbi:hypothetical protein [Streptomyces sp. NPDC005953]|uniref:hypothetical protein n=1 Tax=Streptomyces sp. NPDC005953 TaxID=3156719 RepID=UPI0033D9D1E8
MLLGGAWLGYRRLIAGISAETAARAVGGGCSAARVEQVESGLASMDPQAAQALAAAMNMSAGDRDIVAHLAADSAPVITDRLPGAAERLLAVESVAERVETVALGPLWFTRPPAGLLTTGSGAHQPGNVFVVQDQLLERVRGCSHAYARWLGAVADRAESSEFDVRVVSFRAPEVTHLAGCLGVLCSRLTLPGGRTLYVSEGYDPVYHAPGKTTARAAMDALLAAAVGGVNAAAALRTAAEHHAGTDCRGDAVAGCGCPAPRASPTRAPQGPVIAVIRRGQQVTTVLPSTVTGKRESVSQAAVRALWEQAGCAAVATNTDCSPTSP